MLSCLNCHSAMVVIEVSFHLNEGDYMDGPDANVLNEDDNAQLWLC